jgi:hypothetical protein
VNTGAVVFQGTPAQIAADETMLNRHLGVF